MDNQLSSTFKSAPKLSKESAKDLAELKRILNSTDFSKANTVEEVAEIFIERLPGSLKTPDRLGFIREKVVGTANMITKEYINNPKSLHRFFKNNPNIYRNFFTK